MFLNRGVSSLSGIAHCSYNVSPAGVEVKFKGAFYSVLISSSLVPELNQIELTEGGLLVGASVTLSKLMIKLEEIVTSLPEQKTRTFSAVLEMLRWFAGQQIRNVAVSRNSNCMSVFVCQ